MDKMNCSSFKFLLAAPVLWMMASCDKAEDLGGCQFPEMDEYRLVWSDEFEGPAIDTTKWSFEIGDGCPLLCGWGNNELQYYTDRPENAFINDEGHLVIKSIKETPQYEGYDYTSARMISYNKGDWKYGRMDIRARMPIGKGMWPAVWMLPSDTVYGIWPRSGEIDIMEYLGDKPREVLGTIHYGLDKWRFNSQYLRKSPLEPTFHDEFHIFTCIWTDDCILFQMDGKDIGVANTRSTTLPTTWPFDQYFHMILNIAVGGNLPGAPDASTQFPQTMEVDYVRIFQ
jgi:beta-glucanase (GH16 family)